MEEEIRGYIIIVHYQLK